MSAALLGGMQANATQQMGLFGRIEQRWGVFRYTLVKLLLDSALTSRELLVSLIERVELTEEKEIIIKFRFHEVEAIS